MDKETKEREENGAVDGVENLSPNQPTGQFVNVMAEEMAETKLAARDAEMEEEEPEHLEDRVKTLSKHIV